jgi:hypothetical protein
MYSNSKNNCSEEFLDDVQKLWHGGALKSLLVIKIKEKFEWGFSKQTQVESVKKLPK